MGLAALGAAGLAWSVAEAHRYTLRRVEVPVLRAGQPAMRVLHVSDLHLTPRHRGRVEWVRSLDALDPDLVVVTGDFLGHLEAVPVVLEALEPLLRRPGVFVLGSNDYYAPGMVKPWRYLTAPSELDEQRPQLPWGDLVTGLTQAGWLDLSNAAGSLRVDGRSIDVRGVDDPHIERDRYDRFSLQGADERWDPNWPVMLLSWHAAAAFARWRARRSHLPWRLPSEWEWEKAARGVDGRNLPWGDYFDPSWCHMLQSHAVRPQLAGVGAVDGDESIYGVRDMAGGVRDWTGTVWRLDGLPEQAERVPDDPDPDVLGATEARTVRGGSWLDGPGPCRAAEREGELPAARHVNVGVRLARPLG